MKRLALNGFSVLIVLMAFAFLACDKDSSVGAVSPVNAGRKSKGAIAGSNGENADSKTPDDGVIVDPSKSKNYLARFAEMNLRKWGKNTGEFCAMIPTFGETDARHIKMDMSIFGTEDRFGGYFSWMDFPDWRMPIKGVSGAYWVIPTVRELGVVFDGVLFEKVGGKSIGFRLRTIEGQKHALRYEFREGAGLEIRARLAGNDVMRVENERDWNRVDAASEVVRCFPAMGYRLPNSLVIKRGVRGDYWVTPGSSTRIWFAGFDRNDAELYYDYSDRALCLRPFAWATP